MSKPNQGSCNGIDIGSSGEKITPPSDRNVYLCPAESTSEKGCVKKL